MNILDLFVTSRIYYNILNNLPKMFAMNQNQKKIQLLVQELSNIRNQTGFVSPNLLNEINILFLLLGKCGL
jgi:hypothetical protein